MLFGGTSSRSVFSCVAISATTRVIATQYTHSAWTMLKHLLRSRSVELHDDQWMMERKGYESRSGTGARTALWGSRSSGTEDSSLLRRYVVSTSKYVSKDRTENPKIQAVKEDLPDSESRCTTIVRHVGNYLTTGMDTTRYTYILHDRILLQRVSKIISVPILGFRAEMVTARSRKWDSNSYLSTTMLDSMSHYCYHYHHHHHHHHLHYRYFKWLLHFMFPYSRIQYLFLILATLKIAKCWQITAFA
jgi:hypothetical protein